MYDEKNKDCKLFGTEECALLNQNGCLDCYAAKLKEDDQQKLLAGLKRLREAAPLEEVEPLYTADQCLLCKGSERGNVDCYALCDLAKPSEGEDWSFKIGGRNINKKSDDMLLPLQVCCCKKCRGRLRRLEFLPTIVGLIIAGVGLFVTSYSPIYKQAAAAYSWLPAAMFAGFALLAVIAYAVLRAVIRSAISKKTETDLRRLPPVSALVANGWAPADPQKDGSPKLFFAKKLRETGVYTKKTEEE